MHELSVAESILNTAVARARAEGAVGINSIRVTVGVLTTYIDDSLQFYWDILTEGTLAEGSRIEFRRIEGRLRCLSCGHEYGTQRPNVACPSCDSLWTQPLSGDECYLDSIDIQEEELVCR